MLVGFGGEGVGDELVGWQAALGHQVALGCVFISGVIFLIISVLPMELPGSSAEKGP